jgi:hypothetical protein
MSERSTRVSGEGAQPLVGCCVEDTERGDTARHPGPQLQVVERREETTFVLQECSRIAVQKF